MHGMNAVKVSIIFYHYEICIGILRGRKAVWGLLVVGAEEGVV
jgi:hypothetical protein